LATRTVLAGSAAVLAPMMKSAGRATFDDGGDLVSRPLIRRAPGFAAADEQFALGAGALPDVDTQATVPRNVHLLTLEIVNLLVVAHELPSGR